ncbi:hypothetical protein R1flu_021410 [Riccia fluitans]|uniref:Uncharacterized protein n=1 Tax=Riccia fluitans TaxID=41844 RepID=A0ABD1ZP96_9MARC
MSLIGQLPRISKDEEIDRSAGVAQLACSFCVDNLHSANTPSSYELQFTQGKQEVTIAQRALRYRAGRIHMSPAHRGIGTIASPHSDWIRVIEYRVTAWGVPTSSYTGFFETSMTPEAGNSGCHSEATRPLILGRQSDLRWVHPSMTVGRCLAVWPTRSGLG